MAEKEKKKTKKVSARRKKELQQQQEIEKRSAIATGLIFFGLFISFIFIALNSPEPEPRQKGIDVVMGEHDMGMNKKFEEVKEPTEKEGKAEQPQSKEAEKAEETKDSKSPQSKAEKPAEQTSQTQDKTPAPEMPDKKEKKEKQAEKSEEPGEEKGDEPEDEKTQQKDQKEIDPKNQFTPSENKGDNEETGNEGGEKGSKESESFEKKGEAVEGDNPISDLNMDGRGVKDYPSVKKETQKQGKVVVEITVNKDGEVIKAVPGKRGTTITSLRLKNIAKKAALNTQFESLKNGPNQQVGTMTIKFKLQ